ncbi:MAG: YqgE/AlgH family protein [Bacteroidales bacterium]|nr:YqgE/AlgH family protein [Bacteroidales bacterium]
MKDLSKILQIRYNNVRPAAGMLLLAEPFLGDPFFSRSVVLLIEHNEEGSFGLIINKEVPVKPAEAISSLGNYEGKVFVGGPVQPRSIFYLHTLGQRLAGSLPVIDHLYWGGDAMQLNQMIMKGEVKPGEVRFFLGYSGWSPGQLQDELKRDSWLVTKASADFLLNTPPRHLWKALLQRMGGKYAYWINFPTDPLLN